LLLKRDEVPATKLGIYGQLGWTSWLGMSPAKRDHDADDVLLDIERLSRTRRPMVAIN
jgi:predicted component of type VI protein secretion system